MLLFFFENFCQKALSRNLYPYLSFYQITYKMEETSKPRSDFLLLLRSSKDYNKLNYRWDIVKGYIKKFQSLI